MATPTTKTTFKNYCLRSLGQPVIEINVDDDQLDDRVEEALQYFQEMHYNGVERVFLKHVMTAADLTRGQANDSADTPTDDKDGSTTAN
jgi:nitrogen regulatory protein PII